MNRVYVVREEQTLEKNLSKTFSDLFYDSPSNEMARRLFWRGRKERKKKEEEVVSRMRNGGLGRKKRGEGKEWQQMQPAQLTGGGDCWWFRL